MVAFVSGGLISLFAGLVFYVRVFRHRGAQYSREIVQGFYRGELLKFVVVVAGFLCAFKAPLLSPYTKQYPMLVVVGFALVQSTYWIYPFIGWLKVGGAKR